MAITIKDVAKLANVAPSTVSRVIANNPRISQKTKDKVKEAMKQLGYHPNLHARSLANKSAQAIGIVAPDSPAIVFGHPFFPQVIQGISTKIHQHEYALYLSTAQSEDKLFEEVVRMVQGRRVDGIILLFSSVEDSISVYLQEHEFPFTLIGRPLSHPEKVTSVDTDNVRAAREVTDYLLNLGHRRIGFIGGTLDLVVTIDRLHGYKEALRKANIEVRDDYIGHEYIFSSKSEELANKIMSLDDPPTAFLVADDLMALGVLSALNKRGIGVPEQVSIVSFCNLMFAEQASTPLSSIDINIMGLGCQSAQCLLDLIDNPAQPSKRIIIPHRLIERESCRRISV